MLMMSQWWRKEEHAFRMGIWYGCTGFSQVFGSLVAYGIAVSIEHPIHGGLAGWQVLFIFTGALTIFSGVLFRFMIPDSPSSAWFLSRDEKVMVFERIRSNHQGTGNKRTKMYQIVEALKDPMVNILPCTRLFPC
jgi:ACS family allantoate permease-like MFS transporter